MAKHLDKTRTWSFQSCIKIMLRWRITAVTGIQNSLKAACTLLQQFPKQLIQGYEKSVCCGYSYNLLIFTQYRIPFAAPRNANPPVLHDLLKQLKHSFKWWISLAKVTKRSSNQDTYQPSTRPLGRAVECSSDASRRSCETEGGSPASQVPTGNYSNPNASTAM